MVRTPCFLLLAISAMLCGCGSTGDAPSVGQVYAGPANLTIRREIAPGSASVATVHHGDKLDIIQRRRRFLKVRTSQGAEGWTDERLLMSSAEVAELRRLSADTKNIPSQGKASTYGILNVHAEPQRLSPSYLQVKEGERVDVLRRRLVPKNAPQRKPVAIAAPKPARRRSDPKARQTRIPLPPPPAAPGLPQDWIALSKSRVPVPEVTNASPAKEPEPVALDDWTLIRTSAGQSGWVLTGRLFLAIPDEVAQYAEGRRITSYFSLGKVRDEDKIKDIWLWTTTEKPLLPYDFDSFRVFIWSMHRHRYETAYIQRKLVGYFPVLLERVNDKPGFSLCLEAADGNRYRHSYMLVENLIRSAGQKPCEPETAIPEPGQRRADSANQTDEAPPPAAENTMAARLRRMVASAKKQLLGK